MKMERAERDYINTTSNEFEARMIHYYISKTLIEFEARMIRYYINKTINEFEARMIHYYINKTLNEFEARMIHNYINKTINEFEARMIYYLHQQDLKWIWRAYDPLFTPGMVLLCCAKWLHEHDCYLKFDIIYYLDSTVTYIAYCI